MGSRESERNKASAMVCFFLAVMSASAVLAGCVTYYDYTAPIAGKYDRAGVIVKDFVLVGAVTVRATETHTVSPLGIKRKVEGAKVTYSDLMREAAGLNADDIINVRIDMETSGKTTVVDWFKGWERTFSYTGQALAVKYVENGDTEN